MGKSKKIYCPSCGRKVMTYDGRIHNNLSVLCVRCDKLVTYFFETEEIKLSDKPQRCTSSGVRYY